MLKDVNMLASVQRDANFATDVRRKDKDITNVYSAITVNARNHSLKLSLSIYTHRAVNVKNVKARKNIDGVVLLVGKWL